MAKIQIFIAVAAVTLGLAAGGAAFAQAKPCPPGLDKRNNGCLPPGLAKRYSIGQPLPEGVPYQLILDLAAYGLIPPDGQWLYYLVDGEILRIADTTFIVLEALGMIGQ